MWSSPWSPTLEAVLSIATEGGLLAALRPGAVWAQMGTIGVEGTEGIAALAKEQRPDTYFVDAPVSGSKVPAEQGRLLIFASGPDEARSRVGTGVRGPRSTDHCGWVQPVTAPG